MARNVKYNLSGLALVVYTVVYYTKGGGVIEQLSSVVFHITYICTWCVYFLARVPPCPINFYCRASVLVGSVEVAVSAAATTTAARTATMAEGREGWLNGIGEPDRRRLADTRTMPSRAPYGRATVLFGAARDSRRPTLRFRHLSLTRTTRTPPLFSSTTRR